MDQPSLPSFRQIEVQLRKALSRGLTTTSERRKVELPPALLEAVLDDPEASDEEFKKLLGPKNPPLALLDFDTPSIQRYVFTSQRPVDLAGGSELIGNLTRDSQDCADCRPAANPCLRCKPSIFVHLRHAETLLPQDVVIYAGGGGGLLLVSAEEAEDVKTAIEAILREETHGALASVVAISLIWPIDLSSSLAPIPESMEKLLGPQRRSSRYGATLSALKTSLDRERSRRQSLPPLISPKDDFRRCDICGVVRSSDSRRVRGDGSKSEALCDACNDRWDYGKVSKRVSGQPESFDAMFEGLDRRDLALIYADGANVGQAFQRVVNPAQHRALSLAVDHAMQHVLEAARKICADTFKAANSLEVSPQDLVLSPVRGGDDLILIMPGQAAPQAICSMIEAFERSFDLQANSLLKEAFPDPEDKMAARIQRFGLGVGLAVGRGQFPAHFLLNYAKQLLKSAKGKIRTTENSATRSAVDFMVLNSGTPVSHNIDRLRSHSRLNTGDRKLPKLQLTRRPYAAERFEELVKKTKLLHLHVQPNQIHLVQQEIRRGPELSRNLWRYQHARAEDDKGWDAFRQAMKCKLKEIDALLWDSDAESPGHGAENLSTDYLDACELISLFETSKDTGSAMEQRVTQ